MAPLICVVDDDESVRESLQELLESADYSVEVFGSAMRFLASDTLARCACLVVDIRMPEMDGLELQEELGRRKFRFPVIIITGHGDVPLAVRAMKAGARDFLEKPFNEDTLLDSIRRALEAPLAGPAAAPDPAIAERMAQLTERERQVLHLLVIGHPNKVIAQKLDISFRTVEIHRARVFAKMRAGSVAELVRMVLAQESAPRGA
ncbi:MAG TPA: response regulator FixJ [Rhizomicrobium sp.]|nr:response regulator FixJ [Rhizomicrobium sp.]